MKIRLILGCVLLLGQFLLFPLSMMASEKKELDVMNMSLEDLLNVKIVSASKYEESLAQTPATLIVITQKDIENRGYNSLSDVLTDLPGMDVIVAAGDMNQLIYGRGNSTGSFNERTLLLVDGVEHNLLYTQATNIDTDFPLSVIERIEVLYGPASAVYGPNAFSNIISIVTRTPEELEPGTTSRFFGRIGGGSNSTIFGDFTYLAKVGGIDFTLSYRRYRSDRFDITKRMGYFAEGTIIGNPNLWGPYAQYYPKYENVADNHGIIAKVSITKNLEIGFNNLETDQANGGVYPYDKTLPGCDWIFFRNIFHARYQNDLSKKVSMNILTTYQADGTGPDSTFAQGWNNGTTWDSSRTVELLTWKFLSYKWALFNDIFYKPNKQLIISSGIKYATGLYQKSYEFGSSDQITFNPGDTEYDYEVLFPPILSKGITPGNNYRDKEWGVYVQGKWSTLRENFHLVIGARYDDNNLYGDSFNPRIGAVWQISKKFLVKSNYGTAFQAPAPRNLYAGWGGLEVSNNLKPDEIKTVDFSVIYRSSRWVHDLTVYYNEITNSILQGQNLPQKNIYGLEYKGYYLLPQLGKQIQDVRVHLNYSFTHAIYETALSNSLTHRVSDLIGGIARHKFNLLVDADFFNAIHANVRFNYVGKRPTIISNPIEEVEDYLVTHLNLQWKNLFKKMSLYMSVYNLFDIDYYHPGYDSASAGENFAFPSTGWYSSRLPQAGRTFIMGLQVAF